MIPAIDCDVLVVGGGPAGAACATVLAGHGAGVTLVEAGTLESFRVGETISLRARPVFDKLGLDPDREPWAHICESVMAAWGGSVPVQTPDILQPHLPSWRVDRCKLDRALLETAARAGASVWLECRVQAASRIGNRWHLGFMTKGQRFEGSARLVVEATGRSGHSPCAPREPRRVFDALVGLAVLSAREEGGTGLGAALVESGPHGWWYSASLPEDRELAVFFTDIHLLPADRRSTASWLTMQMSTSPLTHERWVKIFGDSGTLLPVRIFDARSSARTTAIADGWAATGDALMAFDPLTGRGVMEALGSGIELAEWIVEGANLEKDPVPMWTRRAGARLTRYLAERERVYGRESRWRQNEFWRRRRAS